MTLSDDELGRLAYWSGGVLFGLREHATKTLGKRVGAVSLAYLGGFLEILAKQPPPAGMPPEALELLRDAQRAGRTHALEGQAMSPEDLRKAQESIRELAKPGLIDTKGNPIEGSP